MPTWMIALVKELGGITPTVLIGVVLCSAILLILKRWISFQETMIPYLWICLLLGISVLGASGISTFLENRKLAKSVQILSPGEKDLLRSFVEKDKIFYYSKYRKDSLAISLEKIGFIYKAYESGDSGSIYNITHEVFDLLKKHPELLDTPPNKAHSHRRREAVPQ